MKKIMFNDRYGLTQAVLNGRKAQTRRIVPKDTPLGNWKETEAQVRFRDGEVVAIAQSYKEAGINPKVVIGLPIKGSKTKGVLQCEAQHTPGWTNKMFVRADLMPHHIRIINVRVERLQDIDISDEDCMKEGIYPYYYGDEKEKIECGFYPDGFSFDGIDCHYPTPREAYAALIDKISGFGTWESNPYVFVYDFELVD